MAKSSLSNGYPRLLAIQVAEVRFLLLETLSKCFYPLRV